MTAPKNSIPQSRNLSELLDEKPFLQISPTLAQLIGLNEAIVIKRLHQLLGNLEGGMFDGYHWIRMSDTNWQEQFPFWSRSTIRGIFEKLSQGKAGKPGLDIVKVGHFNTRAKWYRIDYDMLERMPDKAPRKKRADYPNFGQWANGRKTDPISPTVSSKVSTTVSSKVSTTVSSKVSTPISERPFSERHTERLFSPPPLIATAEIPSPSQKINASEQKGASSANRSLTYATDYGKGPESPFKGQGPSLHVEDVASEPPPTNSAAPPPSTIPDYRAEIEAALPVMAEEFYGDPVMAVQDAVKKAEMEDVLLFLKRECSGTNLESYVREFALWQRQEGAGKELSPVTVKRKHDTFSLWKFRQTRQDQAAQERAQGVPARA